MLKINEIISLKPSEFLLNMVILPALRAYNTNYIIFSADFNIFFQRVLSRCAIPRGPDAPPRKSHKITVRRAVPIVIFNMFVEISTYNIEIGHIQIAGFDI